MRRALLLGLLALAVPFVQRRIDGLLGDFRAQDEALYLWTGQQVRRLAPGLEGLIADIYWLRTVQYFGGQLAFDQDRNFDLLAPLIDITVTLDPRMEIAYRYGAIFLAERRPAGAGRPREAIALLERGCVALPSNWQLRQDLGFFHFLFLKDAATASRVLMEASELEGAPEWLESLAADILKRGGERQMARRIWTRIEEQSEGQMKHNAILQLWILDALDEADRLTELVERYARARGRRPRTLQELVAAGLLRGLPADRLRIPFEYDPETGRVEVSPGSPLWRPAR